MRGGGGRNGRAWPFVACYPLFLPASLLLLTAFLFFESLHEKHMRELPLTGVLPPSLPFQSSQTPPFLYPSRYLSMEVLKGLDLFKLSAGKEVPPYRTILEPNDIFGLGASLYEAWSRVPLAGAGPEFLAVREGRLTHLPSNGEKSVSEGFERFLRNLLAPRGEDRPTAAEVVGRAMGLLGAGSGGRHHAHGWEGGWQTQAAEDTDNGSPRASRRQEEDHHFSDAKGRAAAAVAAAAAGAQSELNRDAPLRVPFACELPECQARQQRIRALETMILSLTGEG